MSKKLVAEAIGTFILVFFGVGSAVLMGEQIGMHGIALAFGLSIVAAAYGLGAISGAHLNPAVSLGMVTAGRMTGGEFLGYAIAQTLGAILGALVILTIASGKADYAVAVDGLGQNGYGAGYLGEYSLSAALLFEAVATFLFVTVILGATQAGAPAARRSPISGSSSSRLWRAARLQGSCILPARPGPTPTRRFGASCRGRRHSGARFVSGPGFNRSAASCRHRLRHSGASGVAARS